MQLKQNLNNFIYRYMKNNGKFEIVGGNKLYGEIINQTSKNATLPIMSASLLACDIVKIIDYPNISDVHNMAKILKCLNVNMTFEDKVMVLNTKNAIYNDINCDLMKTMRSSIFLLGAMLARFKHATMSLPGGCDIGARPIDIHIDAFKKLGVKVKENNGLIDFDAKVSRAKKIKLRLPSVGATENIIQFACLLKGKTTIINAAKEPEIVDLCNFLSLIGAKIFGAGTDKITIYGVDRLHGGIYRPSGDRIVAGTIMGAVAVAGGDVTIRNAVPYQNLNFIKKLTLMGCQIDYKNDIIHISRENPLTSIKEISTGYYPDFPTDLQSIMLAVSCYASSDTQIVENVFERRFLTVKELIKMGAKIDCISDKEIVVKPSKLRGNKVKALDLRGGAGLVVAGLGAKGKTIVNNARFVDRGYDHLEEMLSNLGANIKRT